LTPPLHLLCVEPRFPGRLGAVADWLVRRRGYRSWFYCNSADPPEFWPESVGQGMDVIQFPVGGVAREGGVPWTRCLERSLCYANGCLEVLNARRPAPVDLVIGRSAGLGSSLFVPVYQPGVPLINLFDYYYHPRANDLADEDGPSMPPAYFHWRRAANAIELVDLENGVTPWTLTNWQRDLFPPEYRGDFVVLHDGVDTRRFRRPDGPRGARTVAGRTLPPEARLVTFIARSADRLRGFDRFYELANRLLRARGDVVCAVVGSAVVQRGLDVSFHNQDYRAHLTARAPVHDPTRVWFLDNVRPAVVAELLAASDLHVYPSRPYPVSRSLVQAMASGCVVLAWDTAPVREFLERGKTALLASDPEGAERLALAALADPAAHRPLGEAAAALAREKYSQEVTMPALAAAFDRVARGRFE
jgi:glycosyltransferase involved in cell wall biosynthesis